MSFKNFSVAQSLPAKESVAIEPKPAPMVDQTAAPAAAAPAVVAPAPKS